MREALARSDLDFSISRSDDSGRQSSEPARLPKILRVASLATACLICGVIVVNALFLQDRKHPAPLLRVPSAIPESIEGPTLAVRPAVPAPSAAQVPVLTRSTGPDPIAAEINRSANAPTAHQSSRAFPARAVESRADAITSFLGTTPEPGVNVQSAQKALVRLGYVLRADGTFGLATRQAIEHYERANGLPVRGELTQKLAHELATRSGVPSQ